MNTKLIQGDEYKEIISEDVIEKYEGKNVLLEEVMIVPHGIVPFE